MFFFFVLFLFDGRQMSLYSWYIKLRGDIKLPYSSDIKVNYDNLESATTNCLSKTAAQQKYFGIFFSP